MGVARSRVLKFVGIGLAITVLCCAIALAVLRSPDDELPAILQKPAFTVFYYDQSLPKGFSVTEEDISYMDGILFIPVVSDDGRRVMITQQALPNDFSKSNDVVGDEKITGANGRAALSHTQGHTTATMISKDRETLVIVNDTAEIGSGTVKDLLRALRPLP